KYRLGFLFLGHKRSWRGQDGAMTPPEPRPAPGMPSKRETAHVNGVAGWINGFHSPQRVGVPSHPNAYPPILSTAVVTWREDQPIQIIFTERDFNRSPGQGYADLNK